MKYLYSLLLGMYFALVIVKGEIVSWFRIQEMFLFGDFHMYGVLGSAIAVGALSVYLIKKFNAKTINRENIDIPPIPRKYKANFIGGSLFGLGWAMTGACPGPLYALFGYGHTVMLMAILCAILGVYMYGVLREKLPH